MLTIPPKVIATCFALVGFAAALVVGIAADNAAATVLWRAMLVMLVSWPLGYLIGAVAWRATEENIQAYKERFPIPEEPARGATESPEPTPDQPPDQPPAQPRGQPQEHQPAAGTAT